MPNCEKVIYQKSYLDGIPFDCISTDDTFGVLGASHEFLGNESPKTELTVRSLRTYQVTGKLYGDGHLDILDQLRQAAEKVELKTLVHPVWGELRLKLNSMSASIEQEAAGGIVNLSFDFVEGGNNSAASYALNYETILAGQNDILMGGLNDYFVGAYSLAGQFTVIADRTLGFVSSVASEIAANMNSGVIWTSDAINSLDFLYEAENNPRSILDMFGFLTAINEIRSSSESVGASVDSFLNLMDLGSGSVVYPDQTGINISSVMSVIRVYAAHSAIYAAIEEPAYFNSYSDSLELLDRVTDVLSKEQAVASDLGEHDLYKMIRNEHAIVIQAIYNLAEILPSKIIVDACGFNPSLVSAFNVYGDANRVIDLEKANPSRSSWSVNNRVEIIGNQ